MSVVIAVCCGLYGMYCCSFCTAVCYTLNEEKKQEKNKKKQEIKQGYINYLHNMEYNNESTTENVILKSSIIKNQPLATIMEDPYELEENEVYFNQNNFISETKELINKNTYTNIT